MEKSDLQEHLLKLGRSRLSEGGSLHLRVISDSMEPMLQIGDELTIISPHDTSIQRGDLVVSLGKRDFITHRVLRVSRDSIQTKGDRWHLADSPIPRSELMGVVIARERNGFLIDFRVNRWRLMNTLLGWVGFVQTLWLNLIQHILRALRLSGGRFHGSRFTWLSLPFRLVEGWILYIWHYR